MTAMQNRAPDAHGPLAYDPLDPVVKHEPYPYYVALRRDEPVKWLPTLGAFGVARYDDIDALLKDGRTSSSAQFWPALLGEYDKSEEHTSELQSLMRISYAVFCLKKKQQINNILQ